MDRSFQETNIGLVLMVKDEDEDYFGFDEYFDVALRVKISKTIRVDSESVKIISTETIDFGSFRVPINTGYHIIPLNTILTFEAEEGRVLEKVTLEMDTELVDQDVSYEVGGALTVESVSATYPPDPPSGSGPGPFDLSATVSNRSDTIPSIPSPLSYYCSLDSTIDPSDKWLAEVYFEGLPPMGETQKTVTLSEPQLHSCFSLGRYYYGAFVKDVNGGSSKLIYPRVKEAEFPLLGGESMKFVWIEPRDVSDGAGQIWLI